MSPGSCTESYPAFARIGLRENPGKNLNQVTCPDRDSNLGHLVSQPDALTIREDSQLTTEKSTTLHSGAWTADGQEDSLIRFLQAEGNSAVEIYRRMSRVYGVNLMSDGVEMRECVGNLKKAELMYTMKGNNDASLSQQKTLFNELIKWFENNAGRQMASALMFLTRYEAEVRFFFKSIVTGDETWIQNVTPETKQVTTMDALKLSKQTENVQINLQQQEGYGYHVLGPKSAAVIQQQLLQQFSWEVFEHVTYSSDLAPSDFHLFLELKKWLGEQRFQINEELQNKVKALLNSLAATFYEEGIGKFASRVHRFTEKYTRYNIQETCGSSTSNDTRTTAQNWFLAVFKYVLPPRSCPDSTSCLLLTEEQHQFSSRGTRSLPALWWEVIDVRLVLNCDSSSAVRHPDAHPQRCLQPQQRLINPATMSGRYSFREQADIIFMYGRANGNGREAVRLYQMAFPDQRQPNHQTFVALYHRVAETGTVAPQTGDRGRPRVVRTPNLEEDILHCVEDDPGISTRQLAVATGTSHSTAWRVLHEQLLYPYHMQHEATFGRDGITNFHNEHVWADRNPRAVFQARHQQQFRINVWAGIVGDCLVGPYVLPARLTGAIYRDFIQNTLPKLLHEDVPLNIRQNMWFMHDGAPAHFSRLVRDTLTGVYHDRWIGRGGPVQWPARSPDLNPLDFYLWGHLKQLVYGADIPDQETLHRRVMEACETIRHHPGVFERVRQSIIRRVHACLEARGGHFEHWL
ncbi:hypothetical protein ANN_20350 [Periplaneta americana]|uniref:DUF4817 domain-containing protein n=1 Tax=Periplaneta americana TaxID=6978 RepID=A0ABQ8SD41_PERAM|nr:hypothetical protein ANN_20350 [Periplaneta americana]